MIALLILPDPRRMPAVACDLIDLGYHVMSVDNLPAAEMICRQMPIEMIITMERLGDRLSHSLILSASRRNPHLNTLMLTDKSGADADELYLLLPSVHALLPVEVTTPMLLAMVQANLAYLSENTRDFGPDVFVLGPDELDDDDIDRALSHLDDLPLIDEDMMAAAQADAASRAAALTSPARRQSPLAEVEDMSGRLPASFQSIRTPLMH